MDRLVEAHPFDVPQSMIERQVRHLLERHQRAQGPASAGAQSSQSSIDELRKKFHPHAERQVKTTLVLEKIAETEKIEIVDGELQKRIEDTARAAGDRAPAVRQYYGRGEARENLRSQMILDRAIDFLLERAVTKEVEPPVDAEEKKS